MDDLTPQSFQGGELDLHPGTVFSQVMSSKTEVHMQDKY